MGALIVIAVTFGLLWVLFILPQQRRVRAHQQLVMSLREGDEVVLSAGIYGRITSLGPEELDLEVAPGVELRVARQAVLRRVEHLAPTDEIDDDEDEDGDYDDGGYDDDPVDELDLDDAGDADGAGEARDADDIDDVEDIEAAGPDDGADTTDDAEHGDDDPRGAADANGAQIDSDDGRGNNARRRGGDVTL